MSYISLSYWLISKPTLSTHHYLLPLRKSSSPFQQSLTMLLSPSIATYLFLSDFVPIYLSLCISLFVSLSLYLCLFLLQLFSITLSTYLSLSLSLSFYIHTSQSLSLSLSFSLYLFLSHHQHWRGQLLLRPRLAAVLLKDSFHL